MSDSEQDRLLKSVLYANRAQAEIYLRNWRNALRDSQFALKHNPRFEKVGCGVGGI